MSSILKDRDDEPHRLLIALLKRRDFMFSSTDRRWWTGDDSGLLMPGVTHPHPTPTPESLKRNRIAFRSPPTYFLTFQGTRNHGTAGKSWVRQNLEAMLNSSKKPPQGMRRGDGSHLPLPQKSYVPPSDVFISVAPEGEHKAPRPYHQLFDSAYSLVGKKRYDINMIHERVFVQDSIVQYIIYFLDVERAFKHLSSLGAARPRPLELSPHGSVERRRRAGTLGRRLGAALERAHRLGSALGAAAGEPGHGP